MKFCVDCKHYYYLGSRFLYSRYCKAADNHPSFDPVTGNQFFQVEMQCHVQRKAGSPCGPSGALFEPKWSKAQQSPWQNIETFFRKF